MSSPRRTPPQSARVEPRPDAVATPLGRAPDIVERFAPPDAFADRPIPSAGDEFGCPEAGDRWAALSAAAVRAR